MGGTNNTFASPPPPLSLQIRTFPEGSEIKEKEGQGKENGGII